MCLTSLTSTAQEPPTSVIPYSGQLFSHGKPVSQDEPVPMAFALYSGDLSPLPASPAAAPEQAGTLTRRWTSWPVEADQEPEAASTVGQAQTVGVAVRKGRFLVHLGGGQQRPLQDSVFDHESLYVVAWVWNGSGIFRLPPQRLNAVPHAVTAKRATHFEVTGTLTADTLVARELTADTVTVNNDLRVTRELTADTVTVNNDLRVTGHLTPHYDSGWVPFSRTTPLPLTHNLNALPVLVQVFVSPNANGVPAFPAGERWKNKDNEGRRGTIVSDITLTTCKVLADPSNASLALVYDNYPNQPRTIIYNNAHVRVLMWK